PAAARRAHDPDPRARRLAPWSGGAAFAVGGEGARDPRLVRPLQMRTRLLRAALAAGVALATPVLAQSRAGGIADPDTREWWKIAEVLSSDAMEGRDIGSPGYDRAADVVAQRFKAAGLKPAGDNGTYFQTFPVHEVKVESAAFAIVRDGGGTAPLRFLQQISVRPTDVLAPSLVGALTFRGYCRAEDLADVKGKVVICFNTKRA